MRKLNTAQIKERNEIAGNLQEAASGVEDAISEFNHQVARLYSELVETALIEYNTHLGKSEAWRDQIVEEMKEYAEARSEKWQESEAAEVYESWVDEWRGVDFYELDIIPPDDIDAEDMEDADNLLSLPESVTGE